MHAATPAAAAVLAEAELLQRLAALDEQEGSDEHDEQARHVWYADVNTFFNSVHAKTHWFCRHEQLARELLKLMPYHDTNPLMQTLWERMAAQLGRCTECVERYHWAREWLTEEYDTDSLLPMTDMLRRLDAERITRSLVHPDQMACAFFEMLHFPKLLLLTDDEVNTAYCNAFLDATEDSTDQSCSLVIPNAARCPGLLPLLAHPQSKLRCRVRTLLRNDPNGIQELSPLIPVLDHWMNLLEFDNFTAPEESCQAEAGRRPFHQPQAELWMGLHDVLEFMKPQCMEQLVGKYKLVNIVLGTVSRDPSAAWFVDALHVLKLLLSKLGRSLWIDSSFPPETVCDFLLAAAFKISEESVHILLVHLFPLFLHSLMRTDSYRKLRRRLVFFLLSQVPQVRSMSPLVVAIAAKQALAAVSMGYTQTNATSVLPTDCVHVWGRALWATLGDPVGDGSQRIASVSQSQAHEEASRLAALVLLADVAVLNVARGMPSIAQCFAHHQRLELWPPSDLAAMVVGVAERAVSAGGGGGGSAFPLAGERGDCRWHCVPALWRDVLDRCHDLPAPLVAAVLTAAAAAALGAAGDADAHLAPDASLQASLVWELPRGVDDVATYNAVGVRKGKAEGDVGVDAARLLDYFRGLVVSFLGHVKLELSSHGVNAHAAMACIAILLCSHQTRLAQAAEQALAANCPLATGATDAIRKMCTLQPQLGHSLLQGLGVACASQLASSVRASSATLQRVWTVLERALGSSAPEPLLSNRREPADDAPRLWWTLARGLLWWAAHAWGAPFLEGQVTSALRACLKALPAMWETQHTQAGHGQSEPEAADDGCRLAEANDEWMEWRPIGDKQTWTTILDECSTADGRDDWLEWLVLAGGIQEIDREWIAAVDGIFDCRRRTGLTASARLCSLAAQLLARGSMLSDDGRVALAKHFPKQAPGVLARGLLENLPSTTSFASRVPRAQSEPTNEAHPTHRANRASDDDNDDLLTDVVQLVGQRQPAQPAEKTIPPQRVVEVIDLTDDTPPPESSAAAETTKSPEPVRAARLAPNHSGAIVRAASAHASSSTPINHHPTILSSHSRPACTVPTPQPHAAAGGFLLEPTFDRLVTFASSTAAQQPPANHRPREVIEVEQDYECDDSVIAAWMNGQVTATPVDRPGAAGSGSGSRHPSSHSAAPPVMSQYEAQLWKAMDNAKGYHKGKQYHHNKPKTGAGSKLALERQQFRKEQAGLGFSSGACSATAAASRQQPQHMRANHANSDVQRRTVPQPPAAVLTDLDDMLRPGSRSLGPTSSILPRRPVITIASLTGRAGPPSGRGAPPTACHAGPTQSVGSQAFKAAPTLNGILQTILTWSLSTVLDDTADKQTAKQTARRSPPCAFKSADAYVRFFRPLLLLEIQASVAQAAREGHWERSQMVADLLETSVVDQFTLARFRIGRGEGATLYQGDVLLLTHARRKQAGMVHLANATTTLLANHLLGLVEEYTMKDDAAMMKVKLCFQPCEGAAAADVTRLLEMKETVQRTCGASVPDGSNAAVWTVSKVTGLVPQLREVNALVSAPRSPLFTSLTHDMTSHTAPAPSSSSTPSIAAADATARSTLERGVATTLYTALKNKLDRSQLAAAGHVVASSRGEAVGPPAISLVQGPPGTGKSTTLLAMVGLLLHVGGEGAAGATQRSATDDVRAYRGMVAAATSSSASASTTGIVLKRPKKRVKKGGAPSFEELVASSSIIAPAAAPRPLARGPSSGSGSASASASATPSSAAPVRRVLICAQSNAAIDELLARLVNDGLLDEHGVVFAPRVVRLGRKETAATTSHEYLLETIVEERMASLRRQSLGSSGSVEQIAAKLQQLTNKLLLAEQSTSAVVEDSHKQAFNQTAVQVLRKQQSDLFVELRTAQGQERLERDATASRRSELRRQVLKEAHVVFATLSQSGHETLSGISLSGKAGREKRSLQSGREARSGERFDAVVIDEAAQALETATLVPLQLLASRGQLVLVGDPKQLPATVLSQLAAKQGLERSLFERLQRAGHRVSLLETQYRMHPAICAFPSKQFYGDRVRSGVRVDDRAARFHAHGMLQPLAFFDVQARHRAGAAGGGASLCNPAEADVAAALYGELRSQYPKESATLTVGVVTPYTEQVWTLKRAFKEQLGQQAIDAVRFSSVDGVQGQEFDVVLISCVRTPQPGAGASTSIGFVADVRRMNVALTRGRRAVWVLGSEKALDTHPHWAALIQHTKQHNCHFQAVTDAQVDQRSPGATMRTKLERHRAARRNSSLGAAGSSQQPPALVLSPLPQAAVAKAASAAAEKRKAPTTSHPQPQATKILKPARPEARDVAAAAATVTASGKRRAPSTAIHSAASNPQSPTKMPKPARTHIAAPSSSKSTPSAGAAPVGNEERRHSRKCGCLECHEKRKRARKAAEAEARALRRPSQPNDGRDGAPPAAGISMLDSILMHL